MLIPPTPPHTHEPRRRHDYNTKYVWRHWKQVTGESALMLARESLFWGRRNTRKEWSSSRHPRRPARVQTGPAKHAGVNATAQPPSCGKSARRKPQDRKTFRRTTRRKTGDTRNFLMEKGEMSTSIYCLCSFNPCSWRRNDQIIRTQWKIAPLHEFRWQVKTRKHHQMQQQMWFILKKHSKTPRRHQNFHSEMILEYS